MFLGSQCKIVHFSTSISYCPKYWVFFFFFFFRGRYADFDKGAAKKYVIDPHKIVRNKKL